MIIWLSLIGAGLMSAQGSATPADVRMKAWDHHQKLKEVSPYKDLEWRAEMEERYGLPIVDERFGSK